MAKKLYIGVMIIGIISFGTYYFLGGFQEIKVNETESLSFRVVGTYFYGKYDDHQLERNFKQAREMIIEDSQGNEHIGIPIKFQNEPGEVNFAAPGLGEHNREVALSLGFSESEVDEMETAGAFG